MSSLPKSITLFAFVDVVVVVVLVVVVVVVVVVVDVVLNIELNSLKIFNYFRNNKSILEKLNKSLNNLQTKLIVGIDSEKSNSIFE